MAEIFYSMCFFYHRVVTRQIYKTVCPYVGSSVRWSVRPSTSRSVGPSICPYIMFDRLPLSFESTRRSDERRNRPAARDRKTIIDPRHHPLNAIWHRRNSKSESKQHQSQNADVILDALTSFSMRWRHSRYTCAILDVLAAFSMRWRHSQYTPLFE